MRSPALRIIRILFAAGMLVLVSLLFIDIRHIIPEKLTNCILFLQFVPSAVKFISAGVAASVGFLVIISLTMLTGRSYCSFLCPLGIFQDVFNRTGGLFRRKLRRFRYTKAHDILRYSVLAITLVLTMFSGLTLLNFLDPYSVFGRTITYFGKPVTEIGNNLLASVFTKLDIYTFVHTPVKVFAVSVYIIPAVFLITVAVMSIIKGRLYCNTLCPVGTFLGLLSKASLLKIRMDKVTCTRCGRCSAACKSSCIDFMNKEIDSSRCVTCFNCLESCPDGAIKYTFPDIKRKTEPDNGTHDSSKRKVILTTLLFLTGARSIMKGQTNNVPVPKKRSTVKEDRSIPVSPPGSISHDHFKSNCTACSLCISQCPNNVLVPSFREFGLGSLMQPRMDFRSGFCAYECTRCIQVCPTGAMMPLIIEAKKLTQIGKARFIKENCIVNTEKTACGACSEACPTKAVHMIPFSGRLVIPETNDDICIGCGHCENACPTVPFKAIYVIGNTVHQAAKKPVNTQTDLKKPEEFPF
ncbi:MAG: 4Fe-4S binding protein [Bacteroidales bacterium]